MLVDHYEKTKKQSKNLKDTGDSQYIYENEQDKACSQHDMLYGNFKDLTRRIASDKILCDKAFNTAKNPTYDVYEHGLASMVYKFFMKKLLIHVQIHLLVVVSKISQTKN